MNPDFLPPLHSEIISVRCSRQWQSFELGGRLTRARRALCACALLACSVFLQQISREPC